MRSDTFTFAADDGAPLFVYRFLPEGDPRAIVHISHGMAEHAARYARLAAALTAAGYAVYANDHRGHGRTAASEADLGFFASTGGWSRVVADLVQLLAHEKREHPGLPLALMGHSMGSFIAQAVVLDHAEELAAVVLSGSNGSPGLLSRAGRLVARIARWRVGERGRSRILRWSSFDAFNRAFAPNRTAFDWLSRDNTEVDRYIADPRCGFEVSTALWIDVLDGMAAVADPGREATLPRLLPIYIFSGGMCAVGESGRGVERLAAEYRAAGLERVTLRIYPGARHETLNEINRDEVTRDLVTWLDEVCPPSAGARAGGTAT